MADCCIIGCDNKAKKRRDVKFYLLPTARSSLVSKVKRRQLWVEAIEKANGTSEGLSRDGAQICCAHFVSGQMSLDISDQDFVPSVFPKEHTANSRRQTLRPRSGVLAETPKVTPKKKVERKPAKSPEEVTSSNDIFLPENNYCEPLEDEDVLEEEEITQPPNSQIIIEKQQIRIEYEKLKTPKLQIKSIVERFGQFRCEVCNSKFPTASGLVKHKQLHDQEQSDQDEILPPVSDIVEKSEFIDEPVHVEDPSFQCNMCNRSFPTNHSLKRHKLLHVRDNRKCTQCGTMFCKRHNHVVAQPQISTETSIEEAETPDNDLDEFSECPMLHLSDSDDDVDEAVLLNSSLTMDSIAAAQEQAEPSADNLHKEAPAITFKPRKPGLLAAFKSFLTKNRPDNLTEKRKRLRLHRIDSVPTCKAIRTTAACANTYTTAAPTTAPSAPVTAPATPITAPPAPISAPITATPTPITAPITTPPTPITAPPTPITAPITAPPTPITAPITATPTPITAPITTPPTPITAPPTPITAPITAPPTPITAPITAPPTPITAPPTPISASITAPPAPISAPITAPITAPISAPITAPLAPITAPTAPITTTTAAVPITARIITTAPAPLIMASTTGMTAKSVSKTSSKTDVLTTSTNALTPNLVMPFIYVAQSQKQTPGEPFQKMDQSKVILSSSKPLPTNVIQEFMTYISKSESMESQAPRLVTFTAKRDQVMAKQELKTPPNILPKSNLQTQMQLLPKLDSQTTPQILDQIFKSPKRTSIVKKVSPSPTVQASRKRPYVHGSRPPSPEPILAKVKKGPWDSPFPNYPKDFIQPHLPQTPKLPPELQMFSPQFLTSAMLNVERNFEYILSDTFVDAKT
ncbi:uncharacterized protein [Eucyclogobius newberryi]|uniref:uncharacterized protein isoform X2 n=1 Tax=Eucyclogobius newberryi TaxID=166745 RepID=UPI003B5BC767